MRLFQLEEVSSTDAWYTPPYIFDGLGMSFDLDPASPEGGVPWVPASRHFTESDDGLVQPWSGTVWLNPPYSKPAPWLQKMRAHGEGVALVPADTATKWFHSDVATADALCFLKGRVRFKSAFNGDSRGLRATTTARFPSVLAGYGEECAAAVVACGLGWVVG